jgi:3',5'-cyclic AMP phosphodiesterase CpdA
MATFRLAHVTDPHFRGPRGFPGARPGELFGKRAVGYLNLAVNRVRKHKMDLLEDMRVDVRAQAPDHLAMTGDLSNIALTSEWRSALAWLDLSGVAPDAISVIPGNHDAYVPEVVATREFERLFAPYQTSDLDREGEAAHYPFVQIREPLALIGVSSAVPTGDLGAWGRIGEAQLARLETILTAPELRGLARVVLVHHPPVLHKDGEHRNLRDRDALGAVLLRAGAELVLHGHDHQDSRDQLPGPGGARIPIIGAGSASYAGGPERRARYSIYEFGEDGAITWTSRVHDEATSFFREARREVLAP